MTGASETHNLIAGNIYAELRSLTGHGDFRHPRP
jgi:hypothetical protein